MTPRLSRAIEQAQRILRDTGYDKVAQNLEEAARHQRQEDELVVAVLRNINEALGAP